ncbi:PX domain-containing protein [Caenorhabditis elegans]|uniref:PX domain-containing protein n=1 Tax=Caenorhabditis elegans TaxID=6239 RepID=Q9GYJ9_CAEEL|nr:PX domain-containing protein [Caenorhabditis elegans]CCD63142.1 PX domain-containing protein [Caenorhabditis elegans]|eukprot:NP_508216.1 Sorting NeXin [Caenorhabditis elegans]
MLSEEDVHTNSYAGRTVAVMEQPDLFSDDCDEINLGNEDTPPSKLRLHTTEEPKESSSPAVINSIEDHDQYVGNDNHYAQISPEPALSNFKVTMREFEKRGDGMNAYIVYKLETEVSGVVGYTKQHYETWRRFSDFLGLHGKIVEKYLAKGIVIPQPPEKSISALTKTKTNSDPAMSREVGIQRARQLERYICRLIQHPRMRNDCDVRDFLTIESDLPKAVQTAALSSFGVKKIFKNFQVVFSKMAFHMEEGDRWFEQVQSQVDELDEALRKLYTVTETLVASRRDMATSGEQLGKALSMLAACEESTSLSRALSSLTDVTENVSAVYGKQAEVDNSKFSESIYEYIMLISALKDVFGERVRAWQQWQDAQQTLARKRDQKTKIDLSAGGRNERSDQLKGEIEDTVQKMDQLEQHFIELSKAIREEVARFDADRKQDMKKMLVEYMESMIHTHTELLHLWEKFEPEANNIRV